MKLPVMYELNGRRRCLLAQDGQTISIGRAGTCSIQLEDDAVQEVELTAQFVNSCQFVVVHPVNGDVPYAQPLPWQLTCGGSALTLLRPTKPPTDPADTAGRELLLQGLAVAQTRLLLTPGQPLLLGSSQECDVVIPDATCPPVLLAMWAAAASKVWVQVLDHSVIVGWLGRMAETEAELELPLSLSIGGRVILVSTGTGDASSTQSTVAKSLPALAPLPKSPAILAKSTDAAPKIVSRQARSAAVRESAGNLLRPAESAVSPAMQSAAYASSPAPLPLPSAAVHTEDSPLLPDPTLNAPAPYRPILFIIASWLLVALAFAISLLPGQGMLPPEQLVLLWQVAGGMWILTLLLGLGVLLK